MTHIDEQQLPDGRRFVVTAASGDVVAVRVLDDGTREIEMPPAGATAGAQPVRVRLDADDAHRLAAVLGGIRLRPSVPRELQGRIGNLVVDWVRIDRASSVVGRTLVDLDLHRVTGMTVIAVVRGETTIASPSARTMLLADDRVVVVGQLRQMPLLQDLLTS